MIVCPPKGQWDSLRLSFYNNKTQKLVWAWSELNALARKPAKLLTGA